MKIVANVKVNHRLLPSYNLPSRRAKRCTITLWGKGLGDIFLTVQSNDDKTGVKYKVKGNLERVFDKYAKDGKGSIIFKEPPHELLINCEGVHLIKFLQALKLVLGGKTPSLLPSTNPQPLKNIPPKKPTCVTITRKEDYPLLNGFPRNCFHVMISGIKQHTFDMRLLSLSELEILDLTDNDLCSVPQEIDLLPKLKSLILSKNKFYLCHDWSWMCGENIGKTLEILDLSHNKLLQLPVCLRRLGALNTLRLDCNNLYEIPHGIGMLRKLKVLSISNNILKYLPGSFARLCLHELQVAANSFYLATPTSPSACFPSACPSLLELAGRTVVDHRLRVGEYDLPRTLHQFLDEVKFCMCGHAVFDWSVEFLKEFDLNSIASQILVVDSMTNNNALLKMYLCSWKCLNSYRRRGR